MALVNAADGTVAANYDYAAFGEPIRITGVMARNNPFRFSTKYADDESDLLYYGYRYYKPSTGTWPNRDPLEENGGFNLYSFIRNNSINMNDMLGLSQNVIWLWRHDREAEFSFSPIGLGKALELKGAAENLASALENGQTAMGIVGKETGQTKVFEDVDDCATLCYTITFLTFDGHEWSIDVNPLPELVLTLKYHYTVNYEYADKCPNTKSSWVIEWDSLDPSN
jgi:RHS repeat-associated protein